MTTCVVDRSPPGALCQAPEPGVVAEPFERLVEYLLGQPNPPQALVDKLITAKRRLAHLGAHARALSELGSGTLVIEATHAMAVATPGHDPYDCDDMLRLDAEATDEIAALGMLLRYELHAGRALDMATAGYVLDDDDTWRGTYYRHALDAATALLLRLRSDRQARGRGDRR